MINITNKKCSYGIKMLAAALCAVVLFCLPIFAAMPLDPSFTTKLKISFIMDEKPISNLKFTVHKIAAWDGTTKFTMDSRYLKYEAIDLEGMKGNDEWLAAATTLTDKLRADNSAPAPAASGITGSDGSAVFTDLNPGVYLIYSEWVKIGDYKYAAVPYFAILPSFDEDNNWLSETVSYPKRQRIPDFTKLNALKVWDDKGYESARPSEVTVHLLKNGKAVETRKLNAANNWKCTFENLSKEAVYSVTEDTVDKYTTTIKEEGMTYVVTNKRKTETKPPSKKEYSGGSGSGKEVVTETFNSLLVGDGNPGTTTEEETFFGVNVLGEKGTKLPQTGLLWWPVIALAFLGIIMIAIGIMEDRNK